MRPALHRAGSGLPRGRDRRPHDGVVLALGSYVAEAGLLEQAAGDAVEERRRDLLAAGVLRIGLDHAAAGRGDQVKGALQRQGRDAAAPVPLVDEEARHSVVREDVELRLVLLAVLDVLQLLWGSELAPRDGDVSVEDQRGVCAAFADQSLLERTVGVVRELFLGVEGVEPRAPAATPHAVVPLGEIGERVPRLGSERPDGEAVRELVLGHLRSLTRRRLGQCSAMTPDGPNGNGGLMPAGNCVHVALPVPRCPRLYAETTFPTLGEAAVATAVHSH